MYNLLFCCLFLFCVVSITVSISITIALTVSVLGTITVAVAVLTLAHVDVVDNGCQFRELMLVAQHIDIAVAGFRGYVGTAYITQMSATRPMMAVSVTIPMGAVSSIT